MVQQPVAGPTLSALEVFIGEWTVEATGPDGQPWPGEGRTTFEWHASRAHLVQRTVTDVPGAPDSVAIVGCDAAKGTFVQLYSDERQVCRIYSMYLHGTQWVLEREASPFPSASWARSARMPAPSRAVGRKPSMAGTSRSTSISRIARSAEWGPSQGAKDS
jgi:hypothetical protein